MAAPSWLGHFGLCADLRIMPTSGQKRALRELQGAPTTSA